MQGECLGFVSGTRARPEPVSATGTRNKRGRPRRPSRIVPFTTEPNHGFGGRTLMGLSAQPSG